MPGNEPHTVYCLHYLGGSGREFAALGKALGCAYHLEAIDLAGFGDCRTTGFSVMEMSDSVVARIRQSALPSWWILGHSMGAKIAAAVARRAEDGEVGLGGLAGLVTLAGSPPGPEPMDDEKRRTMLGWFLGDATTWQAEAAAFMQQNVTKPLPAEVAGRVAEDLMRMNRQAWTAWLTSGSREDWADRVGVLRTPALVIAGADDASLGADAQRALMLPHVLNGRLQIVRDATHLLPLEEPAEIGRLLDEHAKAC